MSTRGTDNMREYAEKMAAEKLARTSGGTPKVDAFAAALPPVRLDAGVVEAVRSVRELMLSWSEFARGLEISGNALPVNAELLAALENLLLAFPDPTIQDRHTLRLEQVARLNGTVEMARAAIAKAKSALPPTDDPLEMARRGGYEEF